MTMTPKEKGPKTKEGDSIKVQEFFYLIGTKILHFDLIRSTEK